MAVGRPRQKARRPLRAGQTRAGAWRGRLRRPRAPSQQNSNKETKDMLELKTDALEASFEAIEREGEEVAALRGEVAALKARVDASAVAGARPALSGAKSEASPFVDNYLRRGLEAGVELKAVSGASDAAGGYAVPTEIDAEIER